MNITVTTATGELLAHCALDECAREIRALAAQFEAAARAANAARRCSGEKGEGP